MSSLAILRCLFVAALLLAAIPGIANQGAGKYKNFRVACYIPVSVVQRFKDLKYLQQTYDAVSAQLKFDKVYIETYRSRVIASDELIESVKKFFTDHGVLVAGGVALSDAGGNGQFVTHSYVTSEDRAYVKKVMEVTAKHFDEIILDDFFFNMNKSDEAIAQKGNRTWTQFRLDLMNEASKSLIIEPARKANPKVKIAIKYPNWYEHFQGLGYDLDKQPKMFDSIYTGTETRDPEITDQRLQQYESFQIFRYFENIKPGGNGGGWVDTFSIRYIDRYAEQLWDTMFAKAPEITIFTLDLMRRPIVQGERKAWKDLHTSLDYDAMVASYEGEPGSKPTMGRVAGYSLEQVDQFLGELGTPIGIASYKPYQSTGEDFLHNWFGMIGIPIDLHPEFPTGAQTVLLTECAKFDPKIVAKMKAQLAAGKNVVITSGLARALQNKGLNEIVELDCTDLKVAVNNYLGGFGAGDGTGLGVTGDHDIIFPQIRFLTNDSWPIIRGQANGNGYPIMLMDRYSKGILYVLAVPDNFSDFYSMPQGVLTAIKGYILGDFPIKLDAPAKVALIPYDNHTFIVQSFLDKEVALKVTVLGDRKILRNLVTSEKVNGEASSGGRNGPAGNTFSMKIKPHSYLVFASEN